MSYSITISGHQDFEGEDAAEQAKAWEQDQFNKALDMVADLDGVMSASFSGNQVSGSLIPPKEAPEDGATAEGG